MKYVIRRNCEDLELEVLWEDTDSLMDAFEKLDHLYRAATAVQTKKKAAQLWEVIDGSRRVSEQIADSGHRVALSLLDDWPDSKANADLVRETGLSRAGVYDQLTGRRGDKGLWFEEDGELYRLSEHGVSETIAFVSSTVSQEAD